MVGNSIQTAINLILYTIGLYDGIIEVSNRRQVLVIITETMNTVELTAINRFKTLCQSDVVNSVFNLNYSTIKTIKL